MNTLIHTLIFFAMPIIQDVNTKISEYKIKCERNLAYLMITSEQETFSVEDNYYLRKAIQEVAIEMEILDIRETSYIMNKHTDFHGDLGLIQRRHQKLKDEPKIIEAQLRLPPREFINDQIIFNRNFKKELKSKMELELDRKERYENILVLNDICYKRWDAMRDAQCEFYYITVRREALKKFKEMMLAMEDEDGNYWDTGRFPPLLPYLCNQ